jgi:hypothetical protein
LNRESALQKTDILLFFYSLEKSVQVVWVTPPSPIFGAKLALVELGEKEVFTFKKNPSLKTGSITS